MGVLYNNLWEALNRAWFDKTQEQRAFRERNEGVGSRRIHAQIASLHSMADALGDEGEMEDVRCLSWMNSLNVEGRRLAHSALGNRRAALEDEARTLHIAMVDVGRSIPAGGRDYRKVVE